MANRLLMNSRTLTMMFNPVIASKVLSAPNLSIITPAISLKTMLPTMAALTSNGATDSERPLLMPMPGKC